MAKKFPQQYGKILYELTKDIKEEVKLEQALNQFVRYLHEQQATHQIDYIIEEYEKLKRKQDEKVRMKITIARDIDQNIIDQIKESFGADEVEVEQDSSILGGIVIEKGNKVINGSVKNQLQKLKQNLLN